MGELFAFKFLRNKFEKSVQEISERQNCHQCLQLNTRVGERYKGRCNSFAMMHFGVERAVGGKRMCDDLENKRARRSALPQSLGMGS